MSAPVAGTSQPQNHLSSQSSDYSGLSGGQNHEGESANMAGSQSRTGDVGVEVSTVQRMSSATLGSVVTSLLATPLDVVRVRLQSQTPSPASSRSSVRFNGHSASFQNLPQNLGVTACCREVFWVGDNAQYCLAGPSQSTGSSATLTTAECAVEETQRKTFTSTFDGLKKIAKNEGPLTLWRGLSPTLLMAVPANVIYFTGYDWLRFNHASPIRRISNDTYSPLIAGSVARVAAALVVSPIEMFRTRMQAASGSGTGLFRTTLNGLYQMTQSQGYTSLWRGLTLTMWRDVPFSGIYWWGYEATRNLITDARIKTQESKQGSQGAIPHSAGLTEANNPSRLQSQSEQPHMTTFLDSFIAGNVSGAIAAFVTTPFDVGKTRRQVFRDSSEDAPAAASRSTMKETASKIAPEMQSMPRFLYHILRTEGAAGLFSGWAARCLKVAPSCGIMISSYELGKRWARVMNEQKEEKKEAL